MFKVINYQNVVLHYKDIGEGLPVVLLHGFMESLDVWGDFGEQLAKKFRVIMIDLLGHGKSGNLSAIHTMEDMAKAVIAILDDAGIDKAAFVGHSMGGYVSLEILKSYPERVKCLVLLHSHPLPDSEERKAKRDEMIKAIKEGRKVQIAKQFVQDTFAPQNVERLSKQVGFLKIIALNTSNDGIIAALEGMKQRSDYRDVLKGAKVPVMYIWGKEDKFIPKSVLEQFELPEGSEFVELTGSGHQGYIEEQEKVLEKLVEFLSRCQ